MKTVPVWEKLKLQIDKLEMMYKQHEAGADVSNAVYWQIETIYQILSSVEEMLGADKVRDNFYKGL